MKKYEKIAEWIRNEVEAGALSLLRKEGIVEGRRGSGSYITANVHRRKNWEEPRQKRSPHASNTG